jgi:preprotein translocase subunit SecG
MTTLLTIIHIIVSLFLVVIVLLQHGKGADMGATFGGASQTVFGTEGPLPLLNKVTTTAAVVFMLTSLGLAYFSSNLGGSSVMQSVQPPPAPVEGALEKAPETIPLPEGQTAAPTESAAKQFPGEAQKPTAAQEQKATPVEKQTEKQQEPAANADKEEKK